MANKSHEQRTQAPDSITNIEDEWLVDDDEALVSGAATLALPSSARAEPNDDADAEAGEQILGGQGSPGANESAPAAHSTTPIASSAPGPVAAPLEDDAESAINVEDSWVEDHEHASSVVVPSESPAVSGAAVERASGSPMFGSSVAARSTARPAIAASLPSSSKPPPLPSAVAPTASLDASAATAPRGSSPPPLPAATPVPNATRPSVPPPLPPAVAPTAGIGASVAPTPPAPLPTSAVSAETEPAREVPALMANVAGAAPTTSTRNAASPADHRLGDSTPRVAIVYPPISKAPLRSPDLPGPLIPELNIEAIKKAVALRDAREQAARR